MKKEMKILPISRSRLISRVDRKNIRAGLHDRLVLVLQLASRELITLEHFDQLGKGSVMVIYQL